MAEINKPGEPNSKSLPNPIAGGKKAPLLDDKKLTEYKEYLSKSDPKAIAETMANRNPEELLQDITAITNLLSGGNLRIQKIAVRCLGNAAEKGVDISYSLPGMICVLDNSDASARTDAIGAFGKAIANESTRIAAMAALSDAISHKSPARRRCVAEALIEGIKHAPKEILGIFVKNLGSADPEVRNTSSKALEELIKQKIDISSIDKDLSDLLDVRDIGVRKDVAYVLGNIPVRRTKDPFRETITKAFADKHWNVRCSVIRGMGEYAKRGERILVTLTDLVEALEDPDWAVRKEAAWALGLAASKTRIAIAIPSLTKLLADMEPKGKDSSSVRGCAAFALAEAAKYEVDITGAIPDLAKLMKDKVQNVRKDAARAFWGEVERLLHYSENEAFKAFLLKTMIDALISEDEEISERAGSTLKKAVIHPKTRGMTLDALLFSSTTNKKEIKIKVNELMLNLVVDHNTRKTMLEALEKSLGHKEDAIKTGAAVVLSAALLEKRPAETTLERLMGILANRKGEEAWGYAAYALGLAVANEDSKKIQNHLIKCLMDRRNFRMEIAEGAAYALTYAANLGADITDSISILVKLLGNPNDDLRGGAVKALGAAAASEKTSEATLEILSGLLDGDKVLTRFEAIGALQYAVEKGKNRNTYGRALSLLLKVLLHDDIKMVETAGKAICHSIDKRKAPGFVRGATQETIRFMQSKEFIEEAWTNSVKYTSAMKELQTIIQHIRLQEKDE